ncbi:MAG: hypothetical protein ACFE95_13240 [Candidatus Hodarchaeota archaeon]
MENNDLQKRLQELSTYFTSDAWQLIDSFLNNLQNKMDQFNITTEEQLTVFSGIEEFILEFVENYKDRAKITFTEALGLIQDIGSPSEILHSMDFPIDQIPKQEAVVTQKETISDFHISNKVVCNTCSWTNEPDSLFCDHCGTRIEEIREDAKSIDLPRIPQEVINYPYIALFLLIYLVLIIIGMYTIVFAYSPLTEPNLEYIPDLFNKLNGISTGMIIPAIILGLIMGLFIRRLYTTKYTHYRFNVHLTQLQTYFSFGLATTFISLWLCLVYVPIRVTRDEFVISVIFLTLICLLLGIWLYKWNSSNVPSDIPYLALLKHLKVLGDYNLRRIKNYNLIGSIVIFLVVTVVWSSVMPYTVFNIPGFTVFGIPAWIALVASLIMLLNGVLLMFYYSWRHINRFIGYS